MFWKLRRFKTLDSKEKLGTKDLERITTDPGAGRGYEWNHEAYDSCAAVAVLSVRIFRVRGMCCFNYCLHQDLLMTIKKFKINGDGVLLRTNPCPQHTHSKQNIWLKNTAIWKRKLDTDWNIHESRSRKDKWWPWGSLLSPVHGTSTNQATWLGVWTLVRGMGIFSEKERSQDSYSYHM